MFIEFPFILTTLIFITLTSSLTWKLNLYKINIDKIDSNYIDIHIGIYVLNEHSSNVIGHGHYVFDINIEVDTSCVHQLYHLIICDFFVIGIYH